MSDDSASRDEQEVIDEIMRCVAETLRAAKVIDPTSLMLAASAAIGEALGRVSPIDVVVMPLTEQDIAEGRVTIELRRPRQEIVINIDVTD